ncbi:MAG: glycosyltransferase [Clostridium sp.]
MKRCLHILPMNKLSGAEKMALLICRNMKEYEPIVACGGDELKSIFEKNGVKSYSLNFSSKNILKTIIGIKNIVKDNNVKIIHAHDNLASLCGYLTKKIFGLDTKVISHIHNCYPWLKTEGINKKIDSALRPRYDHNIACGKVVYDFYKENTNYFNKDKITILSNAMDIEEIIEVDVSNNEEVIKKYNIPKDKIILGFVGRISDQKGIIPFINEISKQREDFNDSKIILVGSGDQDEEVKTLIAELNIEELFILTGHQEDAYKFYPIIDVFLLPSKYEGLPMVLLEAMVFKKSIVSMNVGSVSEVINENTGILIKAGDYREFVNSLRRIKNNNKLIKMYGENSYNYINENYNVKNYISKLEKEYKKIDVII